MGDCFGLCVRACVCGCLYMFICVYICIDFVFLLYVYMVRECVHVCIFVGKKTKKNNKTHRVFIYKNTRVCVCMYVRIYMGLYLYLQNA